MTRQATASLPRPEGRWAPPKRKAPEPLTLSIPDAAAVLGISPRLAYRLAAQEPPGLPIVRFGNRVLVSRPALVRMLERPDAPLPEPELERRHLLHLLGAKR